MTKLVRLSEQQLICHLEENPKGAFEYIYDYYSGALYNIVVHIVKDRQTAQDITQDAFLKIWSHSGTYKPSKGTLFTWMLNITRNTAIDHLRAQRKLEASITCESLKDADLSYQLVYSPSVSSIDLKYFVNRLSTEQRILLETVYFQGYTHEETAQRLGMPLGTVKSRIRSALAALRKVYIITD